MKNRNHRMGFSILLAGILIAAGQLPPEIMADRHMVRLDRLISENRHREAYRLTSEIAEFYEKHNLELPHEFHFKQARVAGSLGLLKEAITALHTYLNKAGKEGARYVDALALLDRTEEKLREVEREAEARRKRIEAERRRAEAIRKRHTDLVNRQIQAASVPLARDPLSSGGLGPEMVTVAKGRFLSDYVPPHLTRRPAEADRWIEIEQPFAISRYEITRGEFRRFVKAIRYRTEAEQRGGKCSTWSSMTDIASWKRLNFDQTDTHPVVCVSRRDAMAYATWLSRETGRNYRLPTAAEWEYAFRAGSDIAMMNWWDKKRLNIPTDAEAPASLCGRANLRESDNENRPDVPPCLDGVEYTAPVGSFPPNGIGLHDMIGNVEEWVSSCAIKGKGIVLQDENAVHCDTSNRVVTARTGYSDSYKPRLLWHLFNEFENKLKSHNDVGFRLVKDFELKAEPGETRQTKPK